MSISDLRIQISDLKSQKLLIYSSAFIVILAGLARYLHQPTFWLDEAFVALSIRDYSIRNIFGPLEYSQYFPRLYLALIALLVDLLGYQIWVLRLLPFLGFAAATALWARLLAKRSGGRIWVSVMCGGLLAGSTFWLDQAIQLKQYTFDVLLALMPFLAGDDLFKEGIAGGKHKAKLALLALPCALSYTYPFALAARVLGWYVTRVARRDWRIRLSGAAALALPTALALCSIWATDHRFNLLASEAYTAYWRGCMLSFHMEHGAGGALQLIAKFLWGWHGRMPVVTAGMVILQCLGVYRLILQLKTPDLREAEKPWGSRSVGSAALLAGVVAASALVGYPICGGRVVLFTQVHTQLLAIEGALLIISTGVNKRTARIVLNLFILAALFHWGREYVRFVRSEPGEDLKPVVALIDNATASTAWVHPCSVAQVHALPAPLPVEQVQFGTDNKQPGRGGKTWVVWSHLGESSCLTELERVQKQAISWRVVHEGPGRGLALAEF